MQQDEAIESSIARFIAGCDSGSSSPPNASPALSPRPSSEKPDQSEELTQTSVLGDQAASTTRSTVDTAHFDCAICQGPMIDPAVGGGCAHHFCHPCYVEWALRKASCPTCRAPVWRIIIDNEFAVAGGLERTPMAICVDKMNGSIGTQLQQAIARDRKTVQMDGPAGLSLANTHNGNGCLVVKVVKNNGAHRAGIRAGDTILMVNGADLHDHFTAIEFIERRCRIGDCEVTFKVRTMEVVMSSANVLLRTALDPIRRRNRTRAGGSPLASAHHSISQSSDSSASASDYAMNGSSSGSTSDVNSDVEGDNMSSSFRAGFALRPPVALGEYTAA